MTLRRALAYSLLIHLVFSSLWAVVPTRDGTPGSAAALRVALVKTLAPVLAPATVPAATPAPQPQTMAKPLAASNSPAVVPAPAMPSPGAIGETNTVVLASESRQAVESTAPEPARDLVSAEGLRQYRLALAREARRYKQYPPLARSRGWEGTVELRVEITAGARPSVGLARSSGHEVLDAEALEMMGRAVLLAVVPVSLQGRSFSVPVPVRFALDE